MRIEVVPALQVQRDLLSLPRSFERFEAYISSMVGPNDEVKLPLFVFNPMAREHVTAIVDDLLGFDAEAVAAEAAYRVGRRLDAIDRTVRLVVMVADDARGGWTDRYITDYECRFTAKSGAPAWVLVLVWSSEGADAERVRMETEAGIYRSAYLERFGNPVTLRDILDQEGNAAVFADASWPVLADDDLAYSIEAIESYLDATGRPTQMACLYGDEAARSVGYDPLGFSPWAGFVVARELVGRRGVDPAAALLGTAD